MNQQANYSRINQIVENQQSLGICITEKPPLDAIYAATALYLGLTKLGKDVSIAFSGQLPPEANFIGTDKIQKELGVGGDTLIISFPYTEGSIDKVSYHIEGENFNLLIQPRQGFDKLNPNQVKYTYTGGKVGALITIDAPTLVSLGDLYSLQEDQFKGKDLINIDRHLTNANFGSVNMVERQFSSTSEIVYNILKNLQIEIDRDIATNLYNGIVAATNNFTSFAVNANTFEVCALLLKKGAIKKLGVKPRPPLPPMNKFTPPQKPVRPIAPPITQPEPVQIEEEEPEMPDNFEETPIKQVENREVKPEEEQTEDSPDDWLKPKIFKGENVNSH